MFAAYVMLAHWRDFLLLLLLLLLLRLNIDLPCLEMYGGRSGAQHVCYRVSLATCDPL